MTVLAISSSVSFRESANYPRLWFGARQGILLVSKSKSACLSSSIIQDPSRLSSIHTRARHHRHIQHVVNDPAKRIRVCTCLHISNEAEMIVTLARCRQWTPKPQVPGR